MVAVAAEAAATKPLLPPVTTDDDDGVDDDEDDDAWPIPGDTDDDPVRRSTFIDAVVDNDGEPPFVDSIP